jgi:Raf kinase inhibitor-like YbhB/YbcL family protein
MYMNKWLITALVCLILAVAAVGIFARAQATEMPVPWESGAMKLNVNSPMFTDGERIPVKYTCDGADVSPPLSWSAGPAATRSYALIVDDPDAPGGAFTHWVVYNIPDSVTRLEEHVVSRGDGTLQGMNSFGNMGYGGPCPPPGKPHHYRFHVYALDLKPDLKQGASKGDVLSAIKGHILAEGELVGTYSR